MTKPDEIYDIDLGHDHWLRFMAMSDESTLTKIGAYINHHKPDGSPCRSAIYFDSEFVRKLLQGKIGWKLESLQPLTVSPSILCLICQDHGYIREGKWVIA